MKRKTGSFNQFKAMTLAVVRGEHKPSANEPKIWVESVKGEEPAKGKIQFHSLEAGAKLLSAKNRELLRTIAKRHPKSVSALAIMTGRAEQNLMRTLHKLTEAGIVRLDRGEGRAYKPVVAASKVHFEIDLLRG
ncbi:MAG: transcriptional regulator [Alphaproteobacteria bacterium]